MSDWMNAKAQRGPLFHLDRGARRLHLLLGLLAAPLPTGARCGHHDRTSRGGLHVEGLLELLDEVRELQERHLLELLEQRVRVRLLRRHDHSSPPSEALASGGSAPSACVAGTSSLPTRPAWGSPAASSPGGTFSLYASSSDRNRPWRAWNMPAALDISALRAPPSSSRVTSCCRGSRLELGQAASLIGAQDAPLHE